MISFILNYLSKGPVSKYSHMKIQGFNIWMLRGHNSVHSNVKTLWQLGTKNVHPLLTLPPWSYISIVLPKPMPQRPFFCIFIAVTAASTVISHPPFSSSPTTPCPLSSSAWFWGHLCLLHVFLIHGLYAPWQPYDVLKGKDQIFCFLWSPRCLGSK